MKLLLTSAAQEGTLLTALTVVPVIRLIATVLIVVLAVVVMRWAKRKIADEEKRSSQDGRTGRRNP